MAQTKPTPTREVAEWENKLTAATNARQPFEEQWYYNMAFYFGRQYAVWDRNGVTSRLVEPPAPRNRVRLISNKIKPVVRREIAKLNKEEAQFFVVPSTSEPSDIAAAKAAEHAAEYSLYEGKFNARRRSSMWWASVTGTGFLKTTCSDYNANITYDAISPFHMLVPLIQEEDIQKQPWIAHVRAVPVEEVHATYHMDVAPDTSVISSTLEQRFFNAMGIKSDNKEIQKNLAYVKEIWINPCKNYPNGGMLVLIDGRVAYAYDARTDPPPMSILNQPTYSYTDKPYEHGEYPFAKITHIPTGRFYGDSVIVDLIPLQKQYNRARSQIVESINRTAKPTLLYEKGSIDPTKYTSEPGQMVPVNPGFNRPAYLAPPDYPQFALQDLDRTTRDMDDNSNQFEVAKGRTPPGVEAASAIAYLQEENDDVLNHTVFSMEQAVEQTGRQTLSLIKQFWNDEKSMKVISRSNAQEILEFKASDMADSSDFRIVSGSMAPRSQAAKQAFITGLMKDGFIPPQQGLRYLNMNETNRLYEEMQADSRHAQRENLRMSKEVIGESGMIINQFDDHATHVYEHGLFMKSQDFEVLDDSLKAQFLNHWLAHKQFQQMELMTNDPGNGQPAEPDPNGQPVGVA